MPVTRQRRIVKRYFTKGEFNPRSKDQLLNYMASLGDKGGDLTPTGKQSTGKKTLEALAKGNSFYRDILDHGSLGKIRSTYADGAERQLDSESRIHAQFTHTPSTMRLSCKGYNLQNIVADKDGGENPASGFRQCVVAAKDCFLFEADFSAIEALLVGYLIKDPNFMRLANLGIHSWHASHILGKPVSLEGSDKEVGKRLKVIKDLDRVQYDKSKICVYGSLYAQSPWGLQKTWPETFPTVADAANNQDLLFQICPKLKQWHKETQLLAWQKGYLGLDDSPWKYRHWFWDVFTWNERKGKRDPGKDSKRVLAYGPQHIAAGCLYEASLRIAKKIKHCYYGKTPIRALIHDSILGEAEDRYKDYILPILKEEMTEPIKELPLDPSWGMGDYLSIGVAIKVGKNWADMEQVDLAELGVASDLAIKEWEEDEE